jgi:hypothetical protein
MGFPCLPAQRGLYELLEVARNLKLPIFTQRVCDQQVPNYGMKYEIPVLYPCTVLDDFRCLFQSTGPACAHGKMVFSLGTFEIIKGHFQNQACSQAQDPLRLFLRSRFVDFKILSHMRRFLISLSRQSQSRRAFPFSCASSSLTQVESVFIVP